MRMKALQQAIYARINDASVTSLLSAEYSPSIFTTVPQQVDSGADKYFPFVSFGQDTLGPYDTKSVDGGDVIVQLDVWARKRSMLDLKEICDAIDTRLRHQPLSITGTTHIDTDLESVTIIDDPDGKTTHAVMLFRVLYLG